LSEPEAAKSFFKSAVDLALKDKDKPDPAAIRSGVARALGAIDGPHVVPVLTAMLDDPSDRVRLGAAYALASMKDPAALDGLLHALDVDYGKENNHARAPEVKAVVVRASARQFEKEPRTRALLKKAADSDVVSVRFLALAETRGAAAETAASDAT